jgi:hypothetical protein
MDVRKMPSWVIRLVCEQAMIDTLKSKVYPPITLRYWR